MTRSAGLLALSLLLVACEVDFGRKPIVDPGISRRIAERRAAINENSQSPADWLALADLYFEGEQYFEAADAYTRAEGLGAPKGAIHGGLANTYLKLGYYQVAVERLRTCFQVDRNQPMCLFALGSVLESNSTEASLADARRAYLHFLAVAPDHPRAAYVKSAIDQINVRIGPADPNEPIGVGPNGPASRPASQPAAPPPATSGPEGIPGHGDGTDAEEVGELNPYGQAIAKALEASRNNDIPAAQEAYREALRIRPNDPSARAGLAETHFARGEIDAAVKEIAGAYDEHPEDPQVRWIFGLVMLQAKQRQKEAFEAWESLVEEYPQIANQLGIPARLEAAKRFMKP